MNATEGWQKCLIAKKKKGGFVLGESFDELTKMCSTLTGEYQEVEFNYNKGQPIIRFQDGKQVAIVDTDYTEKPS